MKKKIGKSIGDAKKRVRETELAFARAVAAYEHWLSKDKKYVDSLSNKRKAVFTKGKKKR